MTTDKDKILSIHPCDCGKFGCDFFGPGFGEYGESFSRKELEEFLKGLPEMETHLKKLLAHETLPNH